MSQVNHSPVLLVLPLVLNSSGGNLSKFCLSHLVSVNEHQLFLNHILQILNMNFSLFILPCNLLLQFLIHLGAPFNILPRRNLLSPVDIQLFSLINQPLLQVVLSLVVYHFVSMMPHPHTLQYFYLSMSLIQQVFDAFKFLFKRSNFGNANILSILILFLYCLKLAYLLLSDHWSTFCLDIWF